MVMIIALLTLTKDLESIIKICILYIYLPISRGVILY
jgi:hypothetical protein